MSTAPEKEPVDAAVKPVRYAVVGLGHIAQAAVLPAFKHAENSRVTALVSGDALKRQKLGKKYKVANTYSYDEYDECLKSGEVDAVYIALPNHLHCEYTVRAAEAGIHVLCEKPMAVTEDECAQMIEVAAQSDVRLMIAYRLHFEEANLKAVELVRAGELGMPRYFSSSFSMQVKEGDIRLRSATGGGTLYDIGIYCINAARYLFQDEPIEVLAASARGTDARFHEVDEMTSATLRFPHDRLATFTSSFGADDTSYYEMVGTKGSLRVEQAYEYAARRTHHLTRHGKTRKQVFAKSDQFAPELVYFSDCVRAHREPEPNGQEGRADVRIITALYKSALEGRAVKPTPARKAERPSEAQEMFRPPVSEPELVHTESPTM